MLRWGIALTVALLLGGCSDDDAPTVLPSLTATPSASPATVEIPAEARALTPQGADAFVRFFFAQMNVAFQRSDPSLIRELTNGECETCENYAEALEAARSKGHFLRGDSFVIANVAAAPLRAKGTFVTVTGSVPTTVEVDQAGRVLRNVAAEGSFRFTVAVKTTPRGWAVSGIARATP